MARREQLELFPTPEVTRLPCGCELIRSATGKMLVHCPDWYSQTGPHAKGGGDTG